MEGPSLFLAAEQLKPFIKKKILTVSGNTHIEKERLLHQKVLDIFSWGKHLVLQFDSFALRIHFMLFGSFEAIILHQKVTGDYQRKNRPYRLQLIFTNGELDLYSCSLKFIETSQAKQLYDSTIDIMSSKWNFQNALSSVQTQKECEIGDVLLDQTIFAGVGNIIKNESLFLAKIKPTTLVKDLSLAQIKQLIHDVHTFSHKFYEWRKQFELKKHYQVYRQSACPICHEKITKKWTGARNRVSYFCDTCQS